MAGRAARGGPVEKLWPPNATPADTKAQTWTQPMARMVWQTNCQQLANAMSHFSEQWLKDHGYVKDSKGDWAKPAKVVVLHAPAVQPGGPAKKPARKRKATRHLPDSPIVEPGAGNGTLGKEPVQKSVSPRVLVRVTAVRKRLLDQDNLCAKYAVDLLRYAGVIREDSPDQTDIEIRQRKPTAEEEEHNLIEVFEL